MEKLAARFAMAHHATGRTANLAPACGAGQSHRAQDTGVGLMDVQPWDHAALHAALRVMVEHGGINPTDHQAARVGVSAPAHN